LILRYQSAGVKLPGESMEGGLGDPGGAKNGPVSLSEDFWWPHPRLWVFCALYGRPVARTGHV